MKKILDVYLHNIFSGQLIQNESGRLSFIYDNKYIKEHNPALSISLPLQIEAYEGDEAKAFFSGLLPDDIIRHRLAKFLGVSEMNPFALLKEIGGECAGALSLYPKGIKPTDIKKQNNEILDDIKLVELLDLLKRRPMLAGSDDIRLSLAGAQDKIAVCYENGKVSLAKGSTPTTHILKPIIEGVKDSVHNEFFCMKLAKLIGIDAPEVEVNYLNKTPYYLIERYDRIKKKDNSIKRLHQEDFCQALGILPEIRYENEGGPNIEKCMNLLKNNSIKPAADQTEFLNRIIFNYLIGNADAHGKNFSFLYKGLKPEISPAYDLLSTAIYQDLSTKMAMKIGKKYRYEEVFLFHWHRIIPDTVTAKKTLTTQLNKIATLCIEKSQTLKASLNNQNISSSVFEEICTIIKSRSQRIIEERDKGL